MELGNDVPNAGDYVDYYERGQQEVANPFSLRGSFEYFFEVDKELALLLHHLEHPHQFG